MSTSGHVRLLYGDLEVTDEVHDWIQRGFLTGVSSEIDDMPPPEGEAAGAAGKTFRRLALLGYSLPALKLLKPLQDAEVADGGPGRKVLKGVELFYSGMHQDSSGQMVEDTPEDIDAIVRNFDVLRSGERAILRPPVGIDHDTAKHIPTELLSNSKLRLGEVVAMGAKDVDLGRSFSGIARTTVRRLAREGKQTGTLVFSEFRPQKPRRQRRTFNEVNMDRAAMLQWLQEHNVDTSTITDAIPDTFLKMLVDMMQELETLKGGGQMSDGRGGAGAGGAGGGNNTGDRLPSSVTMKFSEFERTNATLRQEIANLRQTIEADRRNNNTIAAATRRAGVRTFCDSMVAERRLDPADVACDPATNEPLPGTVLHRLLRAADSPQTHTYSDGGKTVQRTELEIQMEEIRRREPRKFTEKITSGGGAGGSNGTRDGGGKDWKKFREDAIASRQKAASGPPLEQRLNMLPPAGVR